jgi:flagella basal body P-ring formation protein FlgA
MPAGSALTRDDIAKPILVSRGELCRMVVRGRGFHITGEARAREKGALGDEISMESLKTRERFTAMVVGAREVEVRLQREEK